MNRIEIKPLSVNEVWQGKRYKTNKYHRYEKAMLLMLPAQTIPKGLLSLKLDVGYSNRSADIDNCIKPFVDILQKKYGFNDRDIYHLEIDKNIVKKGFEYISFLIEKK